MERSTLRIVALVLCSLGVVLCGFSAVVNFGAGNVGMGILDSAITLADIACIAWLVTMKLRD